MALTFQFERNVSPILGVIYRPIAQVFFYSKTKDLWQEIWMLVDTGADYTLLPKYLSKRLGINLKKDCREVRTGGVGGTETVYFLKNIKAKLGDWERNIPIGFLDRDEIPPLMGRHLFIETFEALFSSNHNVTFSTNLSNATAVNS